jgi:hypothetical protein
MQHFKYHTLQINTMNGTPYQEIKPWSVTSFKLLLCYFTQTHLQNGLKSRALVQACCGTESLLHQPCVVPGGC